MQSRRTQHCRGRSRNGLRYSSRTETLRKDDDDTPVLSQSAPWAGQADWNRERHGHCLGLDRERGPGGEAASHPSLCAPFTQHLGMFVWNLQLGAQATVGHTHAEL